MKNNRHHIRKMVPFKSLKELQTEKFRLQREILATEKGIKNDYGSLVDALTFKNIVNAISEEVIATNMIVSQAYSVIRPLFTRKKKKKKNTEKPLEVEEVEQKVNRRRSIKKKSETKDVLILKGDDINHEE